MRNFSELFFFSKKKVKKNFLFAGEWCFDKHTHLNRNQINIVNRETKRNIIKEGLICKKLYDRLLIDLIKNFSLHYKVNWSKKSWEIFLGPWLNRYVSIIYDRFNLIEYILENYNFKKIHLTKDVKFNLIEQDLISFRIKSQNEDWNFKLFSKIYLRYFDNKDVIKIFKNRSNIKKEFGKNKNISLNIFNYFYKKIINSILSFFKNSLNLVFYKTFFNNRKLILNILFQKNKLYYPYDFDYKISKVNRLSEKRNLKIKSNYKLSKIEKVLRELVYEFLPFYYLELINDLKYLNKNLVLPPEQGSKIFTANALWHDGVFKFWLANAISKQSKLNYFQHGCNYGVTKFSYAENMEVKLSDKFFSWGWGSENKKVKKFYCIKTLFLEKYKKNTSSKVLIILSNPHNFTSYHSTGMITTKRTYIYYRMIENICKKILYKKNFFLRLAPNDKKSFNFENKLGKLYKKINFEKNKKNFFDTVKDYSLIVHTWDSTCFLETISLDKPSVIILSRKLYKGFIKKSALKYYKKLEKAKILFNSESDLFNFLEKKNFNIDEWWNNTKTKQAKKFFCDRYCKKSDKPFNELLKIV